MKYSFGSDNHSGVHPKILKAIERANSGYSFGYGEDDYTEKVLAKLEKLCGGDCTALFVLNGTGANVVALSTFLKPFSAVLAPATAHIIEDECGAVERFSGCRIIPIECCKNSQGEYNGKVSVSKVREFLKFDDQHKVQPIILSISQPTENETLYTLDEIRSLAELVHSHGCYLHVDGSRISNACAAMGVGVKEMIKDTGVDVLSFGGTKNGLLIGEAVVIYHRDASSGIICSTKNKKLSASRGCIEKAQTLKYIRKQATQLYSKNRFIAAQFEEYMKNDLYLKNAAHSNKMAKYLEKRLLSLKKKDGSPAIVITKSVDVNAVYVLLPFTSAQIKALQKKYLFYLWDEKRKEARLMCSFNTSKEAIDSLVSDFGALLNS